MSSISEYITGNPQVTFFKSVYRRHTNSLQQKDKYIFQNNRIAVPVSDELDILTDVWISNINNIKSVALFMIENTVNPDSITVDSVSSTDSTDIMLFTKLNKTILDVLNGENNTNYFKFPISEKALSTCMTAVRNKKILFVIDTVDENIQHNIIIRRSISNYYDEKRRFAQVPHEYLVKKFKTVEYDINVGENVIDMEFINNGMSHIYLNTVKNVPDALEVNVEYNVICDNQINDDQCFSEKKLIYNCIESNSDPEYAKFATEKYDTYIFDAFKNVNSQSELSSGSTDYCETTEWINRVSGHQPHGCLKITKGNCFKINSKIKTKMEITYVIFDVLRIFGLQMCFFSQCANNQLNLLKEVEEAEATDAEAVEAAVAAEAEANADVELEQMRQKQANTMEYHNDKYKEIQKIKLYVNLIYDMLLEIEKKKAQLKFIKEDNENNYCYISSEKIKTDEYYYECPNCVAKYNYQNLKNALDNNDGHIISLSNILEPPSCKSCNYFYKEYPQLYINKQANTTDMATVTTDMATATTDMTTVTTVSEVDTGILKKLIGAIW